MTSFDETAANQQRHKVLIIGDTQNAVTASDHSMKDGLTLSNNVG